MKTTTAARFNEGFSRFEDKGWRKVVVTADHVTDAKAGIKLVKEWVKSVGGKAKVDTFFSAPRWSSNLDLFYRAEIFYKVA